MFTSWLAALLLTTAQVQDPVATDNGADPAPEVASDATPQLQLPAAPAEEPDVVLTSARDYAAFHHTVSGLQEAPIGSAEDLDYAMDQLTRFYGEERLVRAWIAYAAIVAARHPEYIDEVRELADYYGPEAAISGLMNDPAFATSFGSAGEAQDSVVSAIDQDNAEIVGLSERYRAAAYDLQSERWANRVYRDRQERLATLSDIDNSPIELPEDVRLSLDYGVASGLPASALFEPPSAGLTDEAIGPELTLTVGQTTRNPDRERVGRILSIAALQSLDGMTDTDAAIDYLLADPVVERCLAWVRLDLSQCVAAGHFKYEDSFCIAEHALLDVSRCLATETGGD
ncbi:MAG: hypothetical protein NXI03_03765 [Alphaproteobacteria bacterium]|uniref:hypothetical protein n=1 Tax=Maricaulis alexandrii TaxID=2570354 RepID=UPI001108F902|nr:hypothetical protein [Maricaulis alexandrii]MCR9266664.1 hypothetical protein [Alphaproteobacteria bacterium]